MAESASLGSHGLRRSPEAGISMPRVGVPEGSATGGAEDGAVSRRHRSRAGRRAGSGAGADDVRAARLLHHAARAPRRARHGRVLPDVRRRLRRAVRRRRSRGRHRGSRALSGHGGGTVGARAAHPRSGRDIRRVAGVRPQAGGGRGGCAHDRPRRRAAQQGRDARPHGHQRRSAVRLRAARPGAAAPPRVAAPSQRRAGDRLGHRGGRGAGGAGRADEQSVRRHLPDRDRRHAGGAYRAQHHPVRHPGRSRHAAPRARGKHRRRSSRRSRRSRCWCRTWRRPRPCSTGTTSPIGRT